MLRLLFDENLSPRLVDRLAAEFPDSRHIRDLDLRGRADLAIWERAASDGFAIVTKDDDFRQLSFVRGYPPKVIWLLVGNAGTDAVARLLARQREVIVRFLDDAEESLLALRLKEPG